MNAKRLALATILSVGSVLILLGSLNRPFPLAQAQTSGSEIGRLGDATAVDIYSGVGITTTGKASGTDHSLGSSYRRQKTSGGSYSPLVVHSPSAAGVANGDFENGRDGSWGEFSTHDWELVVNTTVVTNTAPAHSGIWEAWLGGDDDDTSYITQSVIISAESPILSFWQWIASEDACGYDWAGVVVNSDTAISYTLCSDVNTYGWVIRTVDLSAYAGQTVGLQFRAETDSSLNSNLFIDDVALGALAPDITVSLSALTTTLNSGQVTTRTLTIGNVGYADLTWNLTESPGVEWLSELPTSGAVISSNSTDVSVIFNATGQLGGVHTSTLHLASNDPDTPMVNVPVTLTVSNSIYLPCVAKNYCSGPLFFDDFTNPNSGWGAWESPEWKFGGLNGEFQIILKNTDSWFWDTPSLVLPSDYVMEVDVRHATTNLGNYGLMFGVRYSGNDPVELYQFIVSPSSQEYFLEKYNNDTWTTLIDWTYDSRINYGMATNHLGVRRVGTSISVEVNSYWLETVYDGDFTSAGRDGGLKVFSYGSAPVDMRFDNFLVTCPQ